MLRLVVDDVITTTREVEVPDACPECGTNLRADSALRVWEYQDQDRHATAGNADDVGDFEWPDLPEGGEFTIVVRWTCAACDHVLAAGREASHDEDVTAPLFAPEVPSGG